MRRTRLLAAICLLGVVWPGSARPQADVPLVIEGPEINIDAEQISYDQRTNTIVARGKVLIERGDMAIRADEVRVNRTTNEADAEGNVSVTTSEGTIVADALHLNLDEETGSLTRAEVRSQRYQYSLWGDHVSKGIGQSYHIENGHFTTCNCGERAPDWSISGRDLRVDLGGYGDLRGGTFNVLNVPIFYVPRAIFPVQRERESGFLQPRFGVSNRRGFQTLLPFYWAINKSHDATVALDVETSARVGVVGEYRYALSRETRGTISASYFNQAFGGQMTGPAFEPTIPENRWNVTAQHLQPLIGTSQAYADVFVVSDDLFLRDINTYAFEHARDVAIRTLPFTTSHVGFVQLWDRLALTGEGTYYQNLQGPDSGTLQRVPEIDLFGQGHLGDHLLGELTATAVDFQRGSNFDGVRLDIEPGVTLPLPLGRFVYGAMRTAVRETAYHLTDPQVQGGGLAPTLPRKQSRETLEVLAEVGTTVARTYNVEWLGLAKLRHTLEPQLAYLYVPAVAQSDLPLFDGVDRVNRRNLLTYGLVSRFIGKFAANEAADQSADSARSVPPIRELARFSLAQSFDLSRDIDPLQAGRAADHFSDVDIDGRVNPSRALSLRFRTNYDTSTNNISAARVGFYVEDPRYHNDEGSGARLETRTSAGVSYRFLTGNQLQEVDTSAVMRLTDWAGFLYASRYDVVANRFLDNFFGLRLISTCDCWALDLAVVDRTNPQEIEVRAQLTLVGLGSNSRETRAAGMQ